MVGKLSLQLGEMVSFLANKVGPVDIEINIVMITSLQHWTPIFLYKKIMHHLLRN